MPDLFRQRWFPPAFGGFCIVAMGVIVEILLRLDILNKYIMPFPSDVLVAMVRVVEEEDIIGRMGVSGFEMLASGLAVVLVGVPLGVLL